MANDAAILLLCVVARIKLLLHQAKEGNDAHADHNLKVGFGLFPNRAQGL